APTGRPVQVGVAVTNTSQVIDGYTARILGVDGEWISCDPMTLSLFPDASGRIVLTITLPGAFPAGRHSLILEVAAVAARDERAHENLDLVVEPVTEASLSVVPPVRSARRRAVFGIAATNEGNTPIELGVAAGGAPPGTRHTCHTGGVRIEPGETVTASLETRVRPRLFGSDFAH